TPPCKDLSAIGGAGPSVPAAGRKRSDRRGVVVEHKRGVRILPGQLDGTREVVGVDPDLETQRALGHRCESANERRLRQLVRALRKIQDAAVRAVCGDEPNATHEWARGQVSVEHIAYLRV